MSPPYHFLPPGAQRKREGRPLNTPGHIRLVSTDLVSGDGTLNLPCRLHVGQLIADRFEVGLIDVCDQLLTNGVMRDEFIRFRIQPHLAVVVR